MPESCSGFGGSKQEVMGSSRGQKASKQREESDCAACEGRGARQQDDKLRFKTN